MPTAPDRQGRALTLMRHAMLSACLPCKGMGFARLFRSRWAAMLWAAGILWTAYDVVGTGPATPPAANESAELQDATGTPVDKDDLAALAGAMR